MQPDSGTAHMQVHNIYLTSCLVREGASKSLLPQPSRTMRQLTANYNCAADSTLTSHSFYRQPSLGDQAGPDSY